MNRKNKRSTYKKYKRNTKKNKRKRGGTRYPFIYKLYIYILYKYEQKK